ncbi:hypothetical protein HNR23_004885 [Nocardiopsis mwathae]|uniref:DUF4429 domain-containing protein n=1 Tax=Nocardiopsis mwathae TaxID=1472723 RepID=A0A7W9YMR4_9ACTN|nr:DUF4429 domain-containing protein [Nocardiopsis mwathae]MBB6174825.1 hypothetical protein [Nocardiopsis mwathae]
MDELRGRQATWRFDGETVFIRYATGWRVHPLLKELAQVDVPVAAIAAVEFTPGSGRGKKWQIRLRLRDRADPFAAVGAMLTEDGQPFLLAGDAKNHLVAEYYADQLAFSVDAMREREQDGGSAACPNPEKVALGLVPPPPLHIQTTEGTASFDGTSLRLGWSDGSAAKRKLQRREFELGSIRRVETTPSDGWNYGFLRVVPRDASDDSTGKPEKNLCCLLNDGKREEALSLLMAATVTAHLWAARGGEEAPALDAGANTGAAVTAGAAVAEIASGLARAVRPDGGTDTDAQVIYDRIRELGRLHAEGLLTDEEFGAKKAELLERL